jgi:CBS domain-containing protein
MQAREMMSTPVITVRPEALLKEVAELMIRRAVSGVPVVDRDGRPLGMISESDFLAREEYGLGNRVLDRLAETLGVGAKPHGRTAGDLMISPAITARPDTAARELGHLMAANAINRIPIVEDGRIVGIVTRADVVRTLIRPDGAITAEVRWRCEHELWISPDDLRVETRSGVVALTGTVETRADAELAKRWARAVDGVVDVEARDLRYAVDDRRIRVSTDRVR